MCHDWYARQSTTTDPGDFAERLGEVPPDPPSMRRIAQTLVFHYRAGGPLDQYGIEPERIAEIDLRYASVMFDRLVALAERRLGEHREPAERVVGCCRDFTLLFLSIARHHGWSARARVGFATYSSPGGTWTTWWPSCGIRQRGGGDWWNHNWPTRSPIRGSRWNGFGSSVNIPPCASRSG